MASVSSHLFAAGDIDYINNLNLVRTDVSGLVTEANAKGTMSTQNANAVDISGGTVTIPKYVATRHSDSADTAFKIDGNGSWAQKNLIGHGYGVNDYTTIRVPSSLYNQATINFYDSGHFEIKNNLGNTTVTCDSNGNVGIGVVPYTVNILHIYKSTQAKQFIESGDNSITSLTCKNSSTETIFGSDTVGGYIGTFTNRPFVFYTNNAERLRVAAGGSVLVNTTTDNGTDKLQVNGGITSTGRIVSTSSAAGVGYATGAGSSVTQSPSISSAVTLNAVSGRITTASTSLTPDSSFSFTLNNSTIGSNDIVLVNLTGYGTSSYTLPQAYVNNKIAGSVYIVVYNRFNTTTTGTFVIDFVVIKGVAA